MTAQIPSGQTGRVLTKTPHAIAVIVAHTQIQYGSILERDPFVLKMLKTAIFKTLRDVIVEYSEEPRSNSVGERQGTA